jgi:2-polyprenyl-3-methyl-5-hydroxy-6-metoxy-1,4-benzoquinol methylase
LDFGCANGNFSKLLKDKLDVEVWGVEIDENAAKVASGKLDHVINKDALEALTQLPDNYFDCILFLDILEHLVDPYSLLDAVKSKLSEQGVIVASIPNIRYCTVLKKLLIKGDWDYQDQGILDKTHLRFFTYKSIQKLFRELEYEILLLEGIGPTKSRTCKWLTKLFKSLEDIKFFQYAVIAKPVENETL